MPSARASYISPMLDFKSQPYAVCLAIGVIMDALRDFLSTINGKKLSMSIKHAFNLPYCNTSAFVVDMMESITVPCTLRFLGHSTLRMLASNQKNDTMVSPSAVKGLSHVVTPVLMINFVLFPPPPVMQRPDLLIPSGLGAEHDVPAIYNLFDFSQSLSTIIRITLIAKHSVCTIHVRRLLTDMPLILGCLPSFGACILTLSEPLGRMSSSPTDKSA